MNSKNINCQAQTIQILQRYYIKHIEKMNEIQLKQSNQQRNNHANTIQIRFALSGHTEICDNIVSIDQLKDQVLNKYGVQLSDQKMITKSGHVIIGNQKLNNTQKFKKSFSSKVPDSMQKYNCIYLYDNRELLAKTSDQIIYQNCQQEAKQLLKSRLEAGISLRNNIFELKSPQNNFSMEEQKQIMSYSPTIKSMLDVWLIYLTDFCNNFEICRSINEYLAEYTDKLENQRKACAHIIIKAILIANDSNIVRIKNLQHRISSQKHLLSTASFHKLSTTRKQVGDNINKNRIKINSLKTQTKTFYIQHERLLKEYSDYKQKIIKLLEGYSKELIKYYTDLVEAVKEKLEMGDESRVLGFLEQKKEIEKQFREYALECNKYNSESEEKFINLYRIYAQSGISVKKSYKIYVELSNQEENNARNIVALEKQVLKQLKQSYDIPLQQPHTKNKQLAPLQRQQVQISRRQAFNHKLQAIQEQLKTFLRQQQKQRKFFMGDILSNNDNLTNKYLENVKVPFILMNYDQTSDLELPTNFSKSKKCGITENWEFYRPVAGIQKILQELESLKNYQYGIRKEEAVYHKVKNMKILLEKSADIFHFAYAEKIKQQERKYQSSIKLLNSRVNILEKEISDLRRVNEQHVTQLQKYKKRQESYLQQISQNIQQLTQQQLHLKQLTQQLNTPHQQHENHQNTQIITKLEQQLKKLKKRQKQLQQSNKQLSNKLIDQLGLLEPLVCQLESHKNKGEEMNELMMEYKGVMGDQQIHIEKLENEIELLKRQCSQLRAPIQKEQLSQKESIDVEEQNMQLNACFYRKEKSETTRDLQKQIGELENERNQLKSQNQQLNEQLMKIMLKDTEDIQIQTINIEQQNQQNNSVNIKKICLNRKVQAGQLRLFVPYSTGIYVIANPSEPDLLTNYQTTKQMQLNNIPYLLDVNCLTSKCRQLFTECSLVVMAKITKILPAFDKYYVEVDVESALGFEDDEYLMRDYRNYLG